MNSNKEIFQAISEVKNELAIVRMNGSKAEQLECFKRLINLYSALNIDIELNKQKAA